MQKQVNFVSQSCEVQAERMYLEMFLKRTWMGEVSLTTECEKICIKNYSPSQTDTFQTEVACKREKGTSYKHILEA